MSLVTYPGDNGLGFVDPPGHAMSSYQQRFVPWGEHGEAWVQESEVWNSATVSSYYGLIYIDKVSRFASYSNI